MILHRDSLIELRYNVSNDILTVKWPRLAGVPAAMIRHSFDKLVEMLKGYDIKNLLIDARNDDSNFQDEEWQNLTYQLAIDLLTTRLQKVARIMSESPDREVQSEKFVNQVKLQLPRIIENRNFQDEPSALEWLTA